jgi:3-deoxy-D-arabino-heptulosonate 7-phosphate (DAHP) synthase
MVEVHNEPDEAICDGPQAIATERFAEYSDQVLRAAELAGKVPTVA